MTMEPVLRLARQIGFGRNDLRRPVDRVDGFVVGLGVLAGVVIVIVGVLLGLQFAERESDVAAQQQATRTETAAVLLTDANASQTALARWTTAGEAHTGMIDVFYREHAGASATIWTDAAGTVVSRPIGALDIVLLVGVTLAGGFTVAFLLLRGLLHLVRLPIKSWSARAWDEDWARTAPRWKQWR
ncbi:hypothetical protein [Kutzneria sp. 744]|uniref:Rv1733c family protein n=1 Tax=Kutzneria sp. (strain 744) TaxID=345341 RepID=UPI0012F7C8C0|nr:hypothetical protein [Kutzneria sp. 744]